MERQREIKKEGNKGEKRKTKSVKRRKYSTRESEKEIKKQKKKQGKKINEKLWKVRRERDTEKGRRDATERKR
jgi:hypothetical protein